MRVLPVTPHEGEDPIEAILRTIREETSASDAQAEETTGFIQEDPEESSSVEQEQDYEKLMQDAFAAGFCAAEGICFGCLDENVQDLISELVWALRETGALVH